MVLKGGFRNLHTLFYTVGRRMDLEMLHYYPDIMENEKAVDMIRELQLAYN